MTDFGTKDYFVAAMKGVIYTINPKATVVDITHEIPPQDIHTAAFVLKAAYKWFPRGTIFVAVVDPGVGTERAPLLVKTKNYYFIGPDNGILSPAAEEDGVEQIYHITFKLPKTSTTFHGRDIFAPTAAMLSLGIPPETLATPAQTWKKLEIPKPHVADSELHAAVIYVDRFGNVYTNAGVEITQIAHPGATLCIETPHGTLKTKFVETYGRANPGETVTLINSEGYLEIAVVMGNASTTHNLKPGHKLKIKKC